MSRLTSRLTSRLALIILVCFASTASAADDYQFNALLFTKTNGWHHKSMLSAVAQVKLLAEKHHFKVDWQEDAQHISTESLKKFDVVIFLLTSGEILNDDQKSALQDFIRSGGGFVGVHSAADTEKNWPWFTKLVGRTFVIHPVIQTALISVHDDGFPGLYRMPNRYFWTDEWYEFGPENVAGLNYLLTVDETTFDPVADWGEVKGNGMGKFHPIAWYHEFDGGRSFYTGLGHLPAVYENPLFQDHLYGGIFWAATGKKLISAQD
ncbi:MAG: ThuA domain-containing protein [Acidiferrobacterales bacterium]|nr:ThuA domain-containing protein [Acidiferrobacterales bacterium]